VPGWSQSGGAHGEEPVGRTGPVRTVGHQGDVGPGRKPGRAVHPRCGGGRVARPGRRKAGRVAGPGQRKVGRAVCSGRSRSGDGDGGGSRVVRRWVVDRGAQQRK
jgi:hypothetical protein